MRSKKAAADLVTAGGDSVSVLTGSFLNELHSHRVSFSAYFYLSLCRCVSCCSALLSTLIVLLCAVNIVQFHISIITKAL